MDVNRKDETHQSLRFFKKKTKKGGGRSRGKWRVWGVRWAGGRIPPFASGPGASLDPWPPKPSIPSIPSTPSIFIFLRTKRKQGGVRSLGKWRVWGFEGPEAGYRRSHRDPVPLSTHGPQNHQYPPYPPLPPILKKKTKKGGGRSLGKWRVWIVWRDRSGLRPTDAALRLGGRRPLLDPKKPSVPLYPPFSFAFRKKLKKGKGASSAVLTQPRC